MVLNKKLVQFTISLGALTAVAYPVCVWLQNSNLSWDKTVVFEIFPVLGLIAWAYCLGLLPFQLCGFILLEGLLEKFWNNILIIKSL